MKKDINGFKRAEKKIKSKVVKIYMKIEDPKETLNLLKKNKK